MTLITETATPGTDAERPKAERTSRIKEPAVRSKKVDGAVKPEEEQPGRLITLTEAAFRLGRVHRTTIMRWVKEGKLKCIRLSRKAILFEPGEIDRFIREHRYSG
ncbi:MAG TPA: helix-turn-helix domain-containing protein [bacterium]|jgi:excisionase family DNA binding protein